MLSSVAQWLLPAQLFALGVAADRDWSLQGLSECWQDCLSSIGEGCDSKRCICTTSEESSAYLPSAVECARSECNADTWALDLFLAPLQLYCEAINCAISDHVIADASAAASGNSPSSTTTTRYSHASTRSHALNNDPTSTYTSTYTKTTTDSDGNILQIIVPIVLGPTGISTGATVTWTVAGSMSSTEMSSSTAALPSSIAQVSGPAPTQSASSTLASGAEETESPANGNGSPFENMQAGAGRWTVSVPVLCLNALAALFM